MDSITFTFGSAVADRSAGLTVWAFMVAVFLVCVGIRALIKRVRGLFRVRKVRR